MSGGGSSCDHAITIPRETIDADWNFSSTPIGEVSRSETERLKL
jgi:hypothetical protein